MEQSDGKQREIDMANVGKIASGPRFDSVDTSAQRPHDRFDYWRSLFFGAAMAPVGEEARTDYRATTMGCFGDDGIRFDDMRCDGIASHYVGSHDAIRLCVLHRGAIQVTHGDDHRELIQPGPGLALFDTSRVADAVSTEGYHAHHIAIPLATARRAMGRHPVAGRDALRFLPDTPLGIMLKAQLALLARYGRDLDSAGTAAAMQALSALATAYLGSFAPQQPEEESAADEALFAAALHLLDRHVDDERLTVPWIAHALRCSRTRLYRIFQRRGVAIAAHIRSARLGHGRTLLRDPRLDIGEIAYRCGYADPSAFGKAFRRAFGMSPREWRMAAA